jgi:hypothetical protein
MRHRNAAWVVTLMAMPSSAAARERFAASSAGVPGAPPVHGTRLHGLADEAVLERVKLPWAGAEMARLKFRHGDVAGACRSGAGTATRQRSPARRSAMSWRGFVEPRAETGCEEVPAFESLPETTR